jgi:hypothetical protein
VKLRDDTKPVLSEFQDSFPEARFIVVMNEASILPAEVHLLDPTQVRVPPAHPLRSATRAYLTSLLAHAAQAEVQFSRFRKRLMDTLGALPVTAYYLYLPRRASIHSTFLKPPSPGFIAWYRPACLPPAAAMQS